MVSNSDKFKSVCIIGVIAGLLYCTYMESMDNSNNISIPTDKINKLIKDNSKYISIPKDDVNHFENGQGVLSKSDFDKKQEVDYSKLHASANGYDVIITNITTRNYQFYNLYSRSDSDRYTQQYLSVINLKIKNTSDKFNQVGLGKACIVNSDGTQIEEVIVMNGHDAGLPKSEYMRMTTNLAPNAQGEFKLAFPSISMLEEQTLNLELISNNGVETISIQVN